MAVAEVVQDPNPLQPAPVDYQSITMTAAIPTDLGVSIEYNLQGTGGPGVSSSGWISDRTWVDTGLSKVTEYSYTVAYRFGGSEVGAPSASLSATTLDQLLNFLDESESLCSELGWVVKGRICGSSPSSCDTGNLEKAAEICQNIGARVCEADELTAANGTGCYFDKKWLWSKTPCNEGFIQVYGKTNSDRRCLAASNGGRVRCCADAVKLAQVSQKRFSQLSGWKKIGGTCGESDKGWSCSRDKTLQQANNICVNKGARLCTVAEIPASSATGCRLDKSYIWTKDICDQGGVSGYFVAMGNDNTNLQCRGFDDVANVRCCAK